jgi:hypothetical protein
MLAVRQSFVDSLRTRLEINLLTYGRRHRSAPVWWGFSASTVVFQLQNDRRCAIAPNQANMFKIIFLPMVINAPKAELNPVLNSSSLQAEPSLHRHDP